MSRLGSPCASTGWEVGSWADPTGTQRGVPGCSWCSQSPGDASPCLHLPRPSSWGGEHPDEPTLPLRGPCKAEFALLSMFQELRGLGDSSGGVAWDLLAKGQGFQHKVSRYQSR